uniref:Uncharacterized protein n=1 Tax=Anthurium amnicola TaxID=1678845 RepID=A0A1D1YBP9_9ARAE
MTSSINKTHKEPDRMSNTRSSSLPENSLNIGSSSLPANFPNIRSSSLPTNSLYSRTTSLPANLINTTSTSLPTNLSNKRSASLPANLSDLSLSQSFTIDERRKGDNNENNLLIEKDSRRYGTYDLNWDDLEIVDDYIDTIETEDPVQDVKPTPTDSIIILSPAPLLQEEPSPSLPSIIPPPISPIAEINNDYDYSDNEEQKLAFPGGITVTTVKVVQIDERTSVKHTSRIPLPKNRVPVTKEINNTYNTLKNQITIKRQKKSTTNNNSNNNNNNTSAQTIKERRKTRIYHNVGQDDITQIKMLNSINNERRFNGVVRRTSSKRRGAPQYRRSYKKRQIQEKMIPAPTSNPFYTNDPTDMEDDENIQSPAIKGFPWIPVTSGPPKLLHASLIPLNQIIKKLELEAAAASSVDVPHVKPKRKSAESISAPRPKRPSQLFRQNLLEQSIALSFNEIAMKSFAAQSAQFAQFAQSSAQSIQPVHKPKRKTVESISAPKPKRPSQIFRENLLEQSVAMSFNEMAMGKNVLASQPKRSSVHKLDREQIESISAPEPKRSSQIFREVLLEESVAMSLDEVIMGRNVFATHRQSFNSKIPRRRFSRRGSNAKFRKEKAEKKKKSKKNRKEDIDNQGEQQIIQKTVNPMVSSKILEADELKLKVEEQLRKKAVLQSPQPPPRHFTRSATEPQVEVIVRRRSKSLKIDKRSVKPQPSHRESTQPFPTHLARRNKSLRWY